MSHPKQTKAIASARLKSDKVDALMLAKLLKADLLPTVWIPPAKQRYVRELVTHRARLGRQRTAVINEVHALYAKRNIDPGMIFHRVRPPAFMAKELSGYGPRIVEEDVGLLPGEEVTENISVAGHHGQVIWLVRERNAPRRWVIDGSGKDGGRATITYTLGSHPDGTTFDRELVYRMPNTLLAVLDWLIIRSRMKADSAEALRRLKRLLESSGEIN
jgi:Transposase/Polyketide cyclase / dehydrase and lipid transport